MKEIEKRCSGCGAEYGSHAEFCNACGGTEFEARQADSSPARDLEADLETLRQRIKNGEWDYSTAALEREHRAYRMRRSNRWLVVAWVGAAALASWLTHIQYIWGVAILWGAVAWLNEVRAEKFETHLQFLDAISESSCTPPAERGT